MQKDLGWTLAQSGALNTANGLVYLLGALLASPVARRFGVGKVFGTVPVLLVAAALVSMQQCSRQDHGRLGRGPGLGVQPR